MRRLACVLIALLLAGCSQAAWDTVGAVLDSIPDPPLEQQCARQGGRYVEVRSYTSSTADPHVRYECRIEKGAPR